MKRAPANDWFSKRSAQNTNLKAQLPSTIAMQQTTVSHVARWAQWFANLSGATSPLRLRFSEGWIFGSDSPPFPNSGGIYIFADAEDIGKPASIDAACQKVLDVGKANDNLVGRIIDHHDHCNGRRIVVYTIAVEDSLVNAFSPHLPTILEKFVFACCVRQCCSIPEWNITFANGKPNQRARSLSGARTPTGADIARWAREFVELPGAPKPATLSITSPQQATPGFGHGQVTILTQATKSGPAMRLEESNDPVICVGQPIATHPNSTGIVAYSIAVAPPPNLTLQFSYSHALEMFLKYSFVRCAGKLPTHNNTRDRN